jgi:hypothetical protein
MQKFKAKLKNVPRNASQVPCSTNLGLNRDQSLSVLDGLKDDKLTLNNSEVNRAQQTGRSLQAKVFVLNLQGNPTMPCTYAKSKRLVKKGVAKVIRRFPFTIQLNFEIENKTQEITLGIDTGYGNIGFSATTSKEEVICGTLKLDGRTKERLDERRMYRRHRRNKLWYRQARFNNRKSSKPEGWLPPSVQRRYDTHLNLINKIRKLLPISRIILEIAKFDIQKIENSSIEGKDYQQGNLYEYQNVRSYLMSRESGKCQLCKKDFKNKPSHIHHIKPRSRGGNDRPNNLVLLHKKCHDKLHEEHLEQTLKSNFKSYKHSTFMNIINRKFYNDISDLQVTYGNITFVDRNFLNLTKTHYNDAFVISGGSNQKRITPFEIKQVHINNRVLQVNRKGFKPSIKREKSKISPGDLFWIGIKKFVCKGMFNKGDYVLFGDSKKKEYFKFNLIDKIFKFRSLVWI